jgi:hypothetical protein
VDGLHLQWISRPEKRPRDTLTEKAESGLGAKEEWRKLLIEWLTIGPPRGGWDIPSHHELATLISGMFEPQTRLTPS